jgi:hypothetical protein
MLDVWEPTSDRQFDAEYEPERSFFYALASDQDPSAAAMASSFPYNLQHLRDRSGRTIIDISLYYRVDRKRTLQAIRARNYTPSTAELHAMFCSCAPPLICDLFGSEHIDCVDARGWTPLHYQACHTMDNTYLDAISGKYSNDGSIYCPGEQLVSLIQCGASPYTQTPDGDTAIDLLSATEYNESAKKVLMTWLQGSPV